MALYIILITSILIFLISYRLLSRDKLSKFTGPRLAAITDLWFFWENAKSHKEPLLDVHRQYGKIVRIGPNKLSFSSNAAIRDIYSVSNDLQKSSWYAINAPTAGGVAVVNTFASSDTKYHDAIKRVIHKHFSLESTRVYEQTIDRTVTVMEAEIQKRFADKTGPDGVFDLALWLQYFALDAISEIAFGKPYGCMESARDVLDIRRDVQWFSSYCSHVGAAPWLDRLLLKNPILLWLNRLGIATTRLGIVEHGVQCQTNREKELADGAAWSDDILDKLLLSKRQNPEVMDDLEVNKVLIGVIIAGADTTASLLAGIFRYLLKHPQVYAKLQAEVDAADDDEFSYSNTARTPYLDAVIKETARIFPVPRFSPERMTPPEGMTIDGVFVPGNTIVGVSMWTSQREPSVWGNNGDEFDPERWMDPERNRVMSQRLVLFGTGKFQCTGMYIAYREMYKLIPSLIKRFTLELADDKTDWKWDVALQVLVRGLNVRAKS